MYPASRCTGSEGPFSSMPLVPSSVFNVDLEQVFLIKLDRESGTVKVKTRAKSRMYDNITISSGPSLSSDQYKFLRTLLEYISVQYAAV